MKSNNNILLTLSIVILLVIITQGCDLFSTRAPEDPNTTRSSFQEPTEPDYVISNLRFAINEKNVDNYIACLSDTMKTGMGFAFTAASEAYARFASIFNNWSLQSERNYFQSVISKLNNGQSPIITLTLKPESQNPDYVVYIGDYYLTVNHNDTTFTNTFTGTMQLTMNKNNDKWYITQWIDTSNPKDSSKSTWSLLKAHFVN